jgi:hypothetical protein
MKTIKQLLMAVLMAAAVLGLTAPAMAQQATDAQPAPPPSAPPQFSAADLENLAAPMALYPDPLIAVMLPAAAYPIEIIQAARFVADTNNLATLDDQPWDDNVKAVARFPGVVQQMNDQLAWTVQLGQAFVQQPSELMDAIQSLRAKAQSVGTLQTTPEQIVVVTNAVVERTYETQIVFVTNTVVQIVPADPQVIYVPVYNPVVVYAPPPTYVYSPATPLIIFGAGIACGIIIANNHCDWHYGGVYYGRNTTVVVYRGGAYGRYPYYPPPPYYRPPPYYPPPGYRPPPPGYRPPGYPPPNHNWARPTPYDSGAGGGSGNQRWQPDQGRMADNGMAKALPSASTMEARGWSSGSGAGTTRPANGAGTGVNRPATGNGTGATRPATGNGNGNGVGNNANLGNGANNRGNNGMNNGNRPATASPQPAQNVSRPAPSPNQSPNVTRPAQSPNPTRPANSNQGGAFGGVSNGSADRQNSNRGAASRGQSSGGGNNRGGRK